MYFIRSESILAVLINVLRARKSVKEDWTMIPFLMVTILGFIVAVFDFIFLQNLRLQMTFAFVGLFLLVAGGYLRVKARLELKKKAGFRSCADTSRLQTMEGHRLVKDGLYKYVRHPLYLGETIRNFGFVIIFSSIYGILLVAVATIFLAFRIRMEERMLIQVFDDEYREYQKKTKRIIPYVY